MQKYFKRVRKNELEEVICEYYRKYVLENKESIDFKVIVNSICIKIIDTESNKNKSIFEQDWFYRIGNFTREIGKITFENLKVIEENYDERLNTTTIYIANAYEVID